MGTRLLSGAGKSSLSLMLVCCLCAFAVPGSARAGATFGNSTCYVQSVNVGGIITWQIKGTTSVNGLVPLNAQVNVTVTFQKKPNGATWIDIFYATQTANGTNGTVNIDTGWQNLTPPPGRGDQYRIHVEGFYYDGNGNKVTIPAVYSDPITPLP